MKKYYAYLWYNIKINLELNINYYRYDADLNQLIYKIIENHIYEKECSLFLIEKNIKRRK